VPLVSTSLHRPPPQAEYRREIAELIDAKRKADEDIIEGLWAQIRALWATALLNPEGPLPRGGGIGGARS